MYSPGPFTISDSAVISGNSANINGGGVYINGIIFNKTGGTLHGYDSPTNLLNRSRNGIAIFDETGGRLRNISAGSNMNSNTYGFWLSDELP